MIDSVAGIALLILAVIAFNNYQRGTLGQWASAKFFGTGSRARPGQQLIGWTGTRDGVDAAGQAIADAATGAAAISGSGTGVPTGPVSMAETVPVRGIRLHPSVASSWAALVDAAAADGVTIAGSSGWRSPEQQAALRAGRGCGGQRVNDPTCKCNPPTATPASSRHCRGLAVDVANCGSGSAAFRWLSQNAERFGWINLPSESWHWSVDGK